MTCEICGRPAAVSYKTLDGPHHQWCYEHWVPRREAVFANRYTKEFAAEETVRPLHRTDKKTVLLHYGEHGDQDATVIVHDRHGAHIPTEVELTEIVTSFGSFMEPKPCWWVPEFSTLDCELFQRALGVILDESRLCVPTY